MGFKHILVIALIAAVTIAIVDRVAALRNVIYAS